MVEQRSTGVGPDGTTTEKGERTGREAFRLTKGGKAQERRSKSHRDGCMTQRRKRGRGETPQGTLRRGWGVARNRLKESGEGDAESRRMEENCRSIGREARSRSTCEGATAGQAMAWKEK